MCPELPQQPVEGGIQLSGFAKSPIAPGEARRAAGELAARVGCGIAGPSESEEVLTH